MEDRSLNSVGLTQLLQNWKGGNPEAFDRVAEYVYDDLRRRASAYMRNERTGHSLQTTGLVHEALIKLIEKREIEWEDRNHFFAVAAQAMRRILVDYARGRRRDKRGGGKEDLRLEQLANVAAKGRGIDLVALDEALTALESFDPRQSKVVELKYFGGMTLDETAQILEVSEATVKRDWQIARAWLRNQLQ